MKGFKYSKPIVMQSIVVQSYPAYWSDTEHHHALQNFYETDRGKWVKANAVSIEKKLTTHVNGITIVTVVALFPETKYSFYILKWG
jgi:hypothetical protein